jgi:hypothetical protein
MNIRRILKHASTTCCRTCRIEIDDDKWNETKNLNNRTNKPLLDSINARYKELHKIQHEKNRHQIYAIDVRTSSGPKSEIICKKHLEQCTSSILDTLRNHV